MALGVPLGLGSGLCWGTADFFGGVQSRRVPALAVAIWSQIGGALVLSVVLLARGERPVAASLALGAAGGVGGGVALQFFYRGLAEGVMSIVAPVSATGAVLPVAVALARGKLPSPVASLGIAAALSGVVLVSRSSGGPTPHPGGRPRLVLMLALGAALGFGLFFVFVAAGSTGGGRSPFWTVAGARGGSLVTLVLIAAAQRRRLAWPGRRIGALIAVGVADTGANVLYAYATLHGNLGVVGVLGSLYPVATVLLARFLLRERLSAGQSAGVVLALTGVALLAAG